MRYCGFLRAFYPGICSREKSRFFFLSVAFTRELNSLFFCTFFLSAPLQVSVFFCVSVCLRLRLLLRRFSGFLATPGPFSSSFSLSLRCFFFFAVVFACSRGSLSGFDYIIIVVTVVTNSIPLISG